MAIQQKEIGKGSAHTTVASQIPVAIVFGLVLNAE